MYTYSAYGLGICSDIPLPELRQARPQDTDGEVTIYRDSIDVPDINEREVSESLQVTPGGVHLWYEDVGSFLIQDGREIVFDPLRDVDTTALRRRILWPCLGVLLHQRGFLVLHGSAVDINGSSFILVGDSGAGKSTLAAALASRSHRVLADDVTAVSVTDTQSSVIPGFPVLKLHPDVAEIVNSDLKTIGDGGNEPEKQCYRTGQPATEDHPLSGLFILTAGNTVTVSPLSSRQAMIELVGQTYTSRLITGTTMSETHFHQCAQLASTIPVKHVYRPKNLNQLSQLVETVEAACSHVV